MKMAGTTTEQSVDDVLESKTKLWYIKLERCNRENCHMSSDLNPEEGRCYEVLHPKKPIKVSYKMV